MARPPGPALARRLGRRPGGTAAGPGRAGPPVGVPGNRLRPPARAQPPGPAAALDAVPDRGRIPLLHGPDHQSPVFVRETGSGAFGAAEPLSPGRVARGSA